MGYPGLCRGRQDSGTPEERSALENVEAPDLRFTMGSKTLDGAVLTQRKYPKWVLPQKVGRPD